VKRTAALAAVLALFLVGVVVGVLGTHLYYAHRLGRPGAPQGMIARSFEEHIARELQLTDEQRGRMAAILREGHDEAERIRAELSPRVREHMRSVHERLLEILTPEQRRRFEELHELHPRRADAFFLGPPPHPPRHH